MMVFEPKTALQSLLKLFNLGLDPVSLKGMAYNLLHLCPYQTTQYALVLYG